MQAVGVTGRGEGFGWGLCGRHGCGHVCRVSARSSSRCAHRKTKLRHKAQLEGERPCSQRSHTGYNGSQIGRA
jgi:hypothetical protein